jgi:hypothetical protein
MSFNKIGHATPTGEAGFFLYHGGRGRNSITALGRRRRILVYDDTFWAWKPGIVNRKGMLPHN